MRVRIPPAAIACTLLLAASAEGQATGRTSSVHGVVFDSVRGRPLRDAFVSILGASQSTTTDARGRFQFDSVQTGVRTIAVQHASLDSLGFSGLSQRADVGANDDDVNVTVPSFATLWRTACGSARAPNDSALVFGTIRDARTKRAVPGAHLALGWVEMRMRKVAAPERVTGVRNEIVDRYWRAEARANERGDYAICGAPTDAAITVSASADSAASGAIELPITGLRVQRHDLFVAAVHGGRAERGVVVGLLTDPSGAPFVDARVSVGDSAELRSDFDGRVVFDAIAGGTQQIVVRYVGTSPIQSSVDVVPGDTVHFAIQLPRVRTLATTFVSSPEHARMLREEYEERKVMYSRNMIDSTAIQKASSLGNMLYDRPNLTVKRRGVGFDVSMPNGRGQMCTPDLRVDGALVNDFNQLNTIPPNRVMSLEIYPHAIDIPPEYQRGGVRSLCGLIAVWTKWAFRIP